MIKYAVCNDCYDSFMYDTEELDEYRMTKDKRLQVSPYDDESGFCSLCSLPGEFWKR